MRIDFTVGVYQQRRESDEAWTALVPEAHATTVSGQGDAKLRERIVDRLRIA